MKVVSAVQEWREREQQLEDWDTCTTYSLLPIPRTFVDSNELQDPLEVLDSTLIILAKNVCLLSSHCEFTNRNTANSVNKLSKLHHQLDNYVHDLHAVHQLGVRHWISVAHNS